MFNMFGSLYTATQFIGGIAFTATVVYAIGAVRARKLEPKKVKSYSLYSVLNLILALILFVVGINTSQGKAQFQKTQNELQIQKQGKKYFQAEDKKNNTLKGNLNTLHEAVFSSIEIYNGLASGYKVAVSGQFNKPVQIIISDNKDLTPQMKITTQFIIAGIQKVDYQKFSRYDITYRSNLYGIGHRLKKSRNVLKYQFKTQTIQKISNPRKVDLQKVADYYWVGK